MMNGPEKYGELIRGILLPERVMELGPGRPNLPLRPRLLSLTPELLFPDRRVIDPNLARCCIAGLWLYHDFLDESHRISQDIATVEGSYWHGMMHRREPDAWNSKYWFRRVGQHPIFAGLAQQAATVGYTWRSPFDFIDDCERWRGTGSAEETTLRQVQAIEWRLLFDYCWHGAQGQTADDLPSPS